MRNYNEKLDLLLNKHDILTTELEKTTRLLDEIVSFDRSSKNKNLISNSKQTPKHICKIVKKHSKKLTLNVLIIGTLVLFSMTSFDFYDISETNPVEITTKYVLENIRGDVIDTWQSWRIVEGTTMYVNIVNSEVISNKNMDMIKSAIASEDTIEIDDSSTFGGRKGLTSKYFMGWTGALKHATNSDTKYHIPTDFDIITSNGDEGNIIITLSNLKDGDGYAGFTKSVVDTNEILKSFITIYDVSNLDDEQLTTIVRHEFGHALGLGHSTSSEDLMFPSIDMSIPYISECNIDAIIYLYDAGDSSKVVCKK